MATTLDELQLDVFGLFRESATHSENRSRITNLAEISECSTDVDIYGDLLAEPNDTEQICSSLKHELGELIGENRKLIEENVKLQENREQLRRNISSLFLTSKHELQRKEQEITQLRKTIKELQRVSKPSLSSNSKHTRLSTYDHDDNTRRHRQDQDMDGRNYSLSMKQRQETYKNMKDYSQSRHKRNNSRAESHSRSQHSMASSKNLMPVRSEKSKKEKERSQCVNTSQSNSPTASHQMRHDRRALNYITTDFKKGYKRKHDESTHKIGSRKKKIIIDFEPQSLAIAMSVETSTTNLENCYSEHTHDYSANNKSKVGIKSKCEIRNSTPTLQHEMLDASSCHSKASEERHEDNVSLDPGITLKASDVANANRVTSIVIEKPLISHVECKQNSLSIGPVELKKVSDSKSAYPENSSTSSTNFSGIIFDSKISKDLHITERADSSISMTEETTIEEHSSGKDSEVQRSATRTLGKCIMKSDDNKKIPLKSNDACNSQTETSNVTVDITNELPVTHITCTSNLILLGDEETTCTTNISPSKYHSLPSEFYPPGIRGNINDTGSHVRHIRGQTEILKNLSTEAYSCLKEHNKSSQISTATTEKNMSEIPNINIQSVSQFNVQKVTSNLCVTDDISKELINYARADDIQKQHGDTLNVMWHNSTTDNHFKKTEDRKCEGIRELQKRSSAFHTVSNVVSQEWVSMVKEMYVDVFKKEHHAFKQEMADQAHSDVKKQSSENKYMMAEKSSLLNIYQSKNSKHRSKHKLPYVKTDTEKCDIPGNLLLDHTMNNSQHVNKYSKNRMTKQAMLENLLYSQKMNDAAVEVGSQPELSPDSSVVTSSDLLVKYTNSSKHIQNVQPISYHSTEKICYHEPDSTSDPKLYSELTVDYRPQMCEDQMSISLDMDNNFVEHFCNMEKQQSNCITQRHCQNNKRHNSSKNQTFDHRESSGSIAGIQRQAEKQHIQLLKLHEHTSSSDENASFESQVRSNVPTSAKEDSDKQCYISTASENNKKLLTNCTRDCTCIKRKTFKKATSDILNQQLQVDYVNDSKACSSDDDTNFEVSVPTLVCDEITLVEEGSLSEFDSDIVCSLSGNAYSLRGEKNDLHGNPLKQCKVAQHKQRIKNKQVNEAELTAYNAKEANKLPAHFTKLSEFRRETVADLDSKIRMAKFKSDEALKLEEDTASRHKTFQELQQQRLVKRSYGYNYSFTCRKT